MPKKVAILYDADALHGDAASRDVLDQIEAVEKTAGAVDSITTRVGATLDLARLKDELRKTGAEVVFNLVESLDGSDRLQTVATMLLEEWRLPFTGCGSLAMMISNNKIESKRRIFEAGLPTPACIWLKENGDPAGLPAGADGGGDWIVKTRDSHASLFMNDDSLLTDADAAALAQRLRALAERHGQPFFAERFVEGREFNLSVLEGESGEPEVLPVAEIRFDSVPKGRPRIVGYAAKWDEDSPEYSATPRTFALGENGAKLAESLKTLAIGTWKTLGLSGYARVDFRVNAAGEAFILEANSNPCLSPDAGLAAAAEQGGLRYDQLIGKILRAGLTRG